MNIGVTWKTTHFIITLEIMVKEVPKAVHDQAGWTRKGYGRITKP